MKSIKNLERLQLLHQLISSEHTGSPKELARRMRICERMVYNLIDLLKDYEANICYDRSRKTYFYAEQFEFNVSISVSVTSKNERTEIFGGSYV